MFGLTEIKRKKERAILQKGKYFRFPIGVRFKKLSKRDKS